jgi:hypothetical protein
MSDEPKHCPHCGGPLMLYYVPGFTPYVEVPGGGEQFPFWALCGVGGVLVVVILDPALQWWGWHNKYIEGIIVIAFVAVAMLIQEIVGRRKQKTAKYGHYVCEKCDRHFEGDALHPLPKQ